MTGYQVRRVKAFGSALPSEIGFRSRVEERIRTRHAGTLRSSRAEQPVTRMRRNRTRDTVTIHDGMGGSAGAYHGYWSQHIRGITT